MKIKHKDLANAVRFLSLDAVEAANSGHPGMPMGMADVATVLFKNFLRFNPKDPSWFNRDRFVLSAGHGSMLLYSLLYLTGYKSVSIDDIKNFRKLDCICAGHPEYHSNSGIETTTGPLGQGLSNAVGAQDGLRDMGHLLDDAVIAGHLVGLFGRAHLAHVYGAAIGLRRAGPKQPAGGNLDDAMALAPSRGYRLVRFGRVEHAKAGARD